MALLGVCGFILLVGPAAARAACPNEALRTGPSASLPDCRGYELVSPANSDGRLFYTLKSALPYGVFPSEMVSPERDSFTYMMLGGPLQEPTEANGTYDQYETVRTADGWRVARRISPSGAQAVFPNSGGLSSDHRYAFTQVGPVGDGKEGGVLADEGDAEYLVNPDGSFELVGIGSLGTEPLAQGRFITPGGQHVIFNTGGDWCVLAGPSCERRRLEPNAPPNGTAAVYDRAADGPTRVVSLLPGDTPPAAGEHARYQGAALDGSTIAFEIGAALYARIDNAETKQVTNQAFTFAGISADGGLLFYLSGGDIYAFDTATGSTKQATSSGDTEVVNVSADGSHVYFVSNSVLDGAEGTSGQPNLYVWDYGTETVTFIATVSSSDLEGVPALTNWTDFAVSPEKTTNQGPGADSSRTTPDGTVLVFESHAQLTAYDNQGHTAIYRYDAVGDDLECVSCNPSGAAAAADARLEAVEIVGGAPIIHNVSEDGTRVIFETSEALESGDQDDANSIYEWHRALGAVTTSLDLISSGNSPSIPSIFTGIIPTNIIFGIDPQAKDIVFSAYEHLLPAAGVDGVQAIYDARVNGGFSEPTGASPCIDEGCRAAFSDDSVSIARPASDQARRNENVNRKRQRCQRGSKKAAKRKWCKRRHHKKARAAAFSMGKQK